MWHLRLLTSHNVIHFDLDTTWFDAITRCGIGYQSACVLWPHQLHNHHNNNHSSTTTGHSNIAHTLDTDPPPSPQSLQLQIYLPIIPPQHLVTKFHIPSFHAWKMGERQRDGINQIRRRDFLERVELVKVPRPSYPSLVGFLSINLAQTWLASFLWNLERD